MSETTTIVDDNEVDLLWKLAIIKRLDRMENKITYIEEFLSNALIYGKDKKVVEKKKKGIERYK